MHLLLNPTDQQCWALYIGETHLTPAEKLTTGKKKPSTLKSSNMPWTGWPLIRKDMLGAPRSRQQLTTSSEFSKCWLIEATARGIRPIRRGENKKFSRFMWRLLLKQDYQKWFMSHVHIRISKTVILYQLVRNMGITALNVPDHRWSPSKP